MYRYAAVALQGKEARKERARTESGVEGVTRSTTGGRAGSGDDGAVRKRLGGGSGEARVRLGMSGCDEM